MSWRKSLPYKVRVDMCNPTNLLVEALNVTALADVQGSVDEHFEEVQSSFAVDLAGNRSILRARDN